jgi:hypothetical protein
MRWPSNRYFTAGVGLTTLALLVTGAVLWLFDPARHGFYPRCQLYTVTGLQCPGCGGLRALHALLHGHVAEAFKLNALFVVALPVMIGLTIRWLRHQRRDPAARFTLPTHWLWIGLAAAILFGVARNLTFGDFGWLGQ